MREKFDINVCYKKVFEMLGNEGTIEKMVCDIAAYTDTRIVVVDIGGKILSSSDENWDMEPSVCKKQSETLLGLIAHYIETQKEEALEASLLIEEEEQKSAVNRIVVKGNTEGFSIMKTSADEENERLTGQSLCQVNDILCQALGLLMERYGQRIYYHASTLRRMIARSLFEEEGEDGLKIREIRSMYDTYVLPGFIVAVLEMGDYNMIRLQKTANSIADEYPDSFIYIKEGRIYVLFSGVHANEAEKRIAPVLEGICGTYGFFCGVSEAFEDIGLVEKKHFMVTRALEIGQASDPERRIYREYDYYIQIVCSCALPYIGKARYLERELNELKREDQMKGTCFYNTLREYLLNGNNVSMTSKKLFIHRNTMIYRLGKINEILGVDINAPAVSHRLLLSIILQDEEK